MTNTKKTTTNPTDTLAELEAETIAAQAAAEAAAAARGELLAKLATGDATVTAADMTSADAEVNRADMLAAAAASKLRAAQDAKPLPEQPTLTVDQTAAQAWERAAGDLAALEATAEAATQSAAEHEQAAEEARERASEALAERAGRLRKLPPTDVRLAEYVAQAILRHVLSPADVVVSSTPVEGLSRSILPVLTIAHAKPSDEGSGILSGTVRLCYEARTAADPVPDLEKIKRALTDAGWKLWPAGNSGTSPAWTATVEADRVIYRASLAAGRAWASVPTLAPPRNAIPWELSYSWRVSTELEGTLRKADPLRGVPVGSVRVQLDLLPLDETTQEGMTTLRLGARATVLMPDADRHGATARKVVAGAWSRLVGALDSRYGCVVSVEPVSAPAWAQQMPPAESGQKIKLGGSVTVAGVGMIDEGTGSPFGGRSTERTVQTEVAATLYAELLAVRQAEVAE